MNEPRPSGSRRGSSSPIFGHVDVETLANRTREPAVVLGGFGLTQDWLCIRKQVYGVEDVRPSCELAAAARAESFLCISCKYVKYAIAMDVKPLPRLEVEPLFDRIVHAAGGMRVDALVGSSPSFENADYYFESERVIAELKIIEKDDATDHRTNKKIHDLYMKWAYKGLVPLPPIEGNLIISTADLTDEQKKEFIKPFRATIQAPTKKAARQIKQTKQAFNMPDALGLLILVNEANAVMRPDVVFNILHHLLKGDNREINHVVYATVNLPLILDKDGNRGPMWAPASIEGRKEISAEFLSRLVRCWKNALDNSYGLRIPTITNPEAAGESMATVKFDTEAEAKRRSMYLAPGKFYKSKALGYSYYCDDVKGGTATIYLVESYQHGRLIQAIYTQKLIWSEDYEVVENRQEQDRLKGLLAKMKASE